MRDMGDMTRPEEDFKGIPLKVKTESLGIVDEQVAVRQLSPDRYLVLLSPGFYGGLAAGDVIRYDAIAKEAEVISRGGCIAVRVYKGSASADVLERFRESASAIGGKVDGELEGFVVVTFPPTATFPMIEEIMTVPSRSGVEWEYGNVYDEHGRPIGWWE